MKINRREFLSITIAGTIGAALDRSVFARRLIKRTHADPFHLRPLGNTDLKVSLIGAGTGMRGGNRQSNMTRLGKEKFEALLRYGFDKGIRYFDCADSYGSHPYLASAFKSIPREEYVISTKIWIRPRGGIPEAERPDVNIVIDRFRKELNTDYIDLVLFHCMFDPDWTKHYERQMDIMADLKTRGIIRAHGVSVHSLGALKTCVDNAWVDSVHVRVNAYGDHMDDKDPDVVSPIIQQLHDAGKGVVGIKLIGEGRYSNDPEKRNQSIKYVLGLESVDTLVVGFERPEEIDDYASMVKKVLAANSAK